MLEKNHKTHFRWKSSSFLKVLIIAQCGNWWTYDAIQFCRLCNMVSFYPYVLRSCSVSSVWRKIIQAEHKPEIYFIMVANGNALKAITVSIHISNI